MKRVHFFCKAIGTMITVLGGWTGNKYIYISAMLQCCENLGAARFSILLHVKHAAFDFHPTKKRLSFFVIAFGSRKKGSR